MAANIFETLRARVQQNQTLPEYERRALYWFQTEYQHLTAWQHTTQSTTFSKLRQEQFKKRLTSPTQALPGRFYFFRYDPVGRNTLPYYDRFPLVLPLNVYPGGDFMGLNFHYLNYERRARLFDALYHAYGRDLHHPLEAHMAATYDAIKDVTKYKAFRPCVKRYTVSAVKTPLLQIGVQDWDLALFLPVELFAKSTKGNVWLDSETKIV